MVGILVFYTDILGLVEGIVEIGIGIDLYQGDFNRIQRMLDALILKPGIAK